MKLLAPLWICRFVQKLRIAIIFFWRTYWTISASLSIAACWIAERSAVMLLLFNRQVCAKLTARLR